MMMKSSFRPLFEVGERLQSTVIAQDGDTTLTLVPVPWNPPAETISLKPGQDPQQLEIKPAKPDPEN